MTERQPSTTHRLPARLRLGAVRLQVSSLERAIDYYSSVLGMRVLYRGDDVATLGAQADDVGLVELVAHPGTLAVRPQSRLGLYHFALLLPHRQALGGFLAHISRAGVRVGASNHLVSEAIYLTDPDGLGIEVYADRPRSEWRVVSGQVEMASAPLDTSSLLADAEDWSGMPGGTVMGHVHLHVGDIELASRFYHDALGLDRTVWSYPGALFLSAGGYHHHLALNTWAGAAPPPSEYEAQLLEWRIVLPSQRDADDAVQRFRDAGHGVATDEASWVAADPWGTRLRIQLG